jgi:hypothetical protein
MDICAWTDRANKIAKKYGKIPREVALELLQDRTYVSFDNSYFHYDTGEFEPPFEVKFRKFFIHGLMTPEAMAEAADALKVAGKMVEATARDIENAIFQMESLRMGAALALFKRRWKNYPEEEGFQPGPCEIGDLAHTTLPN